MKKIHVFVLVGLTAFALVACSRVIEDTPVRTGEGEQPPPPTEQQLPVFNDDLGSGIAMGGDDTTFDELFLSDTTHLAFIDDIVGRGEAAAFINEVIEPNKWEKQKEPLIYTAIQYFSIPEETFREHNNLTIEANKRNGTAAVTFSDEEIEALYCGDTQKMVQALKSPYAFLNGEELYTVYELLRLNSRELVDAGIDLDAAEEYCSWIQGELHRESGTEWINEAIIDFQQEVQSAR